MSDIRLGVIGMSDGNGHPYSWSAIFNGYDPAAMARCPFPSIPAYLGEHKFPDEAIPGARVTQVYADNAGEAAHIAAAARIDTVVARPEDMIGAVDAILLARDDAENHLRFAAPFLAAGLPIYIDKPIAIRMNDLRTLLDQQRYPGQIFTCSALRYARELKLSQADRGRMGALRHVVGSTPKSWERYAVHMIDPLLAEVGEQGEIIWHRTTDHGGMRLLALEWASGLTATFHATGKAAAPIGLRYLGESGYVDCQFRDSFAAFKSALEQFVAGVRAGASVHDIALDAAIVQAIEAGMVSE